MKVDAEEVVATPARVAALDADRSEPEELVDETGDEVEVVDIDSAPEACSGRWGWGWRVRHDCVDGLELDILDVGKGVKDRLDENEPVIRVDGGTEEIWDEDRKAESSEKHDTIIDERYHVEEAKEGLDDMEVDVNQAVKAKLIGLVWCEG
jgi:hypothetical protein